MPIRPFIKKLHSFNVKSISLLLMKPSTYKGFRVIFAANFYLLEVYLGYRSVQCDM